MSATIFIDGEAGTTGLQIRDKLKGVSGLKLASLATEARKDSAAKRKLYGEVDVVILCLPDEAAKEAARLIDEMGADAPRVIDASSAHRVAPGWIYGFPELVAGQGEKIADWVAKGDSSEFALAPEEARRRAAGPNDTDVLATANFRLGEYLFDKGHRDEALKCFAEARRLRPESWSFKRQTWELEQAGKAAGSEFFAEVGGLGDKHYYAPLKMKGSAK